MMGFVRSGKPALRPVPSPGAADAADGASRSIRFGWLIVLLGVGGFFLWALLAPLDKGVPVSGHVAVAGNRKAVQHLTGGAIDDILVREGDRVAAGQPLVKMNMIQAKASADITRGQWIAARLTQARLSAERDGETTFAMPAELEALQEDADADGSVRGAIGNSLDAQRQLLASRQSALQSELAALDESIAGLRLQAAGLQEALQSQKEQQLLLKEQLAGMRDLARDGYIARNRLLEMERLHAQTAAGIAENAGNIGRSQRQLAELALKKTQRRQEYQKEVRTQLAEAKKEADALASKLASQDADLANTIVKAPVAGTVVALNVFTRGGVVSPGFRMMDIVPSDDPLVVEALVPVHLIDKVKPGLPVELIFSAFNVNRTPHVAGTVTRVSADRIVDENTGTPNYTVQAQVTDEGRAALANLEVRPGMPVDVFIRTGERTMMSYLLKPVIDRAGTSMTEE